jgi:hypothetical protein
MTFRGPVWDQKRRFYSVPRMSGLPLRPDIDIREAAAEIVVQRLLDFMIKDQEDQP